jgi:hypothetical protein
MSFGSWFRDHPRLLEYAYRGTHWIVKRADPLLKRMGYDRVESWIHPPEELGKKVIFDCRMCGQCILHSTGMTCPMTCPKNLRNGPCGGVRQNGNCEVNPEMRCVWVGAFERSQKMPFYGQQIRNLQPPVNRQLEDRSAWMTMLSGEDQNVPYGWEDVSELTILDS